MDRVKDKVIVITGAASGLGLADSRVLAREAPARQLLGRGGRREARERVFKRVEGERRAGRGGVGEDGVRTRWDRRRARAFRGTMSRGCAGGDGEDATARVRGGDV